MKTNPPNKTSASANHVPVMTASVPATGRRHARVFTRAVAAASRQFGICSALAACLCNAPLSQGATFKIFDPSDTTNVTSLRGAILESNRRGGNNNILLYTNVYQLSLAGGENGSAGGLVLTRGTVTIGSATTNMTVITAAGLGDRVLHVSSRARLTLSHVIITGGTTANGTNGVISAGGYGIGGAGIYNEGTLTLLNCVVTGNSTGSGGKSYFGYTPGGGGPGGGIYNSGMLVVLNSIISSNSTGIGAEGDLNGTAGSGGDGAGIYNTGQAALFTSTIIGNITGTGGIGYTNQSNGGRGGNGAGIYNLGSLALNRSTVSGNLCGIGGNAGIGPGSGIGGSGGDGGGIYNADVAALTLCTISGNSGGVGGIGGDGGVGGLGGFGGGIFNAGAQSNALVLLSCTVAANSTGMGGAGGNTYFTGTGDSGGNGGAGGDGGGIINVTNAFSAALRNTLVALNSDGAGGAGGLGANVVGGPTNFFPNATNGSPGLSGSSPDLDGSFISQRFNLIGESDGSDGFVDAVGNDLVGSISTPIDPLLGPLQNNSGPTATQALLPGSPAINQGKAFGLGKDQRGLGRTYQFPGIPNALHGDGTDIGAFELQPFPPQ